MCIMFRDQWIILFFKIPFCGDFSLHLHKMVQETSRNITQAENLQRHVFWNLLMLTSIHLIFRACWMGENTELWSEDHVQINDKSLQDTDRNKSKPPETSSWATLVCSTQSATLSVIAPIFLKSGFVKLPDGMSRWSFELVCEILRVPIFVRVFFILSIRNSDLQSGVCCIK